MLTEYIICLYYEVVMQCYLITLKLLPALPCVHSVLTLGNLLSSSISEMMFIGLLAIISRASWLSVNSMCSQLMCSKLYSSCSNLKTCCTKNCCRFSLAQLMHSCSKLTKKPERYNNQREESEQAQTSSRQKEHHSPVDGEILKSEDVEQPDGPVDDSVFSGRGSVGGSVDFVYDPHK